MADKLKRCPFCGGEARILTDMQDTTTPVFSVVCDECESITYFGDVLDKEGTVEAWNTRPNPWHTGTPTEKGLYVVLTKVSMKDVSSSEGTYILDYWDGYAFQYLKRKAMVYFPIAPDTYGWVKWQKIEED